MIRANEPVLKAIISEYFKVERDLILSIRNYDDMVFDLATCRSNEIANVMYNLHYGVNINVYVKVYYPKWRWSSALGYFSEYKRLWYKPWKFIKTDKKIIHLNGYKLDRAVPSLVGTLAHELVHVADSLSSYSFGHGNNKPEGKQNTAPYWVGTCAKKLCDKRLNKMLSEM